VTVASQRAVVTAGSVIGIKPANPQRTGMGRAHSVPLPVGSGGRGAAIRRDVANRQRLATVLGGGDGGF
jgi:hypothetical protein